MARLKRVWILVVVCTVPPLCANLLFTKNPYVLLARIYNQPTVPSRPFDAAKWPRRLYTDQQLPLRQAMTDSILKEFRPGMTRKEIEAKLGTPDRFEIDQDLMTGNERELGFIKGDTATSYFVLQDFASGPFSLCFVFDQKLLLKRVFYRWG